MVEVLREDVPSKSEFFLFTEAILGSDEIKKFNKVQRFFTIRLVEVLWKRSIISSTGLQEDTPLEIILLDKAISSTIGDLVGLGLLNQTKQIVRYFQKQDSSANKS